MTKSSDRLHPCFHIECRKLFLCKAFESAVSEHLLHACTSEDGFPPERLFAWRLCALKLQPEGIHSADPARSSQSVSDGASVCPGCKIHHMSRCLEPNRSSASTFLQEYGYFGPTGDSTCVGSEVAWLHWQSGRQSNRPHECLKGLGI